MQTPRLRISIPRFLSTQPVKRILLLGVLIPSQTFAFISEITSKYPNIHFDFMHIMTMI
jgi:hypothetical protein